MSTLSTLPPRRTDTGIDLVTGPVLFRVLTTSSLGTGGARHRLRRLTSVVFKRGVSATAARTASELVLTVPDRSMSGTHARLVKHETGWRLEDLGSSHGTWVGGQRRKSVELGNNTWFVLGTSTFRFAGALPDPEERPDDLIANTEPPIPALMTLSNTTALRLRPIPSLAPTTLPLLINGPTGSGKEWVAHAIHQLSGRAGPFVPVNCAALPENLAESELFGYRRGAFSGATADRVGLIEASSGGTLFLDEVAELSPATQARLLRVLQERQVRPVGATEATPVDLRVVAATHVDLAAAVANQQFREDLLARLSGARLVLQSLGERIEDLGLLVASTVRRLGRPELELTPDAGRRLLEYNWPRNLRELDQAITRGAALAADGLIRSSSLVLEPAVALDPSDERLKEQLLGLLSKHGGNVSAVAREMGKNRRQIQRWMKRFDIR